MPDMKDVVFAVYQTGGSAGGVEVASACGVDVGKVDRPLAEAVADGYLDRGADPSSGYLRFTLSEKGRLLVEAEGSLGGGISA